MVVDRCLEDGEREKEREKRERERERLRQRRTNVVLETAWHILT